MKSGVLDPVEVVVRLQFILQSSLTPEMVDPNLANKLLVFEPHYLRVLQH
jgi:hypothetical protein